MAEEQDIDLTEEEEEGEVAAGDSPISQDATPEPGVDTDDDGKADDDGSVDDDAERDPDGYIVDPSTSGGTPGDEPVTPPEPEEPEVEYVNVLVTTEEIVSDYSPERLLAYRDSGATAIAVYDDGTEEAIPWAQVVDPAGAGATAASEADAIARATNQHFWHRATDPSGDGAGTGAFVTDVEQDEFLEQAAGGWPDWQPDESQANYRPFHNLLQNSQGILLRSALRHIAAFSHSAVTFFDGLGNGAGNIVAQFGKNLARIGYQSDEHIDIGSDSVTIFEGMKRRIFFGKRTSDDAAFMSAYGYGSNGALKYTSTLSASALALDELSEGDSLSANATNINIDGLGGGGNVLALSADSGAYPFVASGPNNKTIANIDPYGSLHLAKSQGVYTEDTTGFEYPMIHDNGSNLWIGATATAAKHHKGVTLISTGHNGSSGNPSIRVCVPNAANNGGTSYYVYHEGYKPSLTALSGTLGINNGGTGSAGISISTGASLVTSADATVTACSLSKWGPLACLSVTFTPKSSWANGAQLKVGTVALPANRPTTQVGGGAAGITAGCSPAGSIFANNNTGAARTASTTLSFVYLCDI